MKKAAVMLYPMFSMQEISCTTELFKLYDKDIVTYSAGREPVKSEDGFTILPDRGFDTFCREEVDCLLLPGIWDPLPVMMDERNIRFLTQFWGDERIVLGSISSSPLLLGRAGLLEGYRFTHAAFEEFLDAFPVLPRENAASLPLVEDRNLVTAIGDAFREFAVTVARKVGIDCPDTIFSGITENSWAEGPPYHFPPEDLPQARAYWDSWLAKGQDFSEKNT